MPKGDWIETFTGRRVYPLSPEIDDINITDIAHALSNLCRFTGHTKRFYSVAEHSARMAEYALRLGQPNVAKYALLHDASEAYLCDLARPVKHLPQMEPYRTAEAVLQTCINAAFDLTDPPPMLLATLDEMFLYTEAATLMPTATTWPGYREAILVPDLDPMTLGLAPTHACAFFLQKFGELFWNDGAHAVAPAHGELAA